MPILKLGKKALASLPSVTKPTVFFDEDLKGFGLRVMPAGSRTWIVEYRPGSGGRRVAKRRLALGSADVLTPDQARKAARDRLAAVRLGADPAADKAAIRQAETLDELSRRYERDAGANRKDSTKELYAMYWRVHIRPALGRSLARDVSRSDVVKLHRAVGETRTVTANRVVRLLAAFYRWAGKEGVVPKDFNPALEIDRFREEGRERFLSQAEFARLGEALRTGETVGFAWVLDADKPNRKHVPKKPENQRTKVCPYATAAIRLLLLTGARLREILHLTWDQVDLERGLLFVADSKTGKKAIVLGADAALVIEGLPRIGQFVIAGQDPAKPRSDLNRPWALISKQAGLEGVRLHDLRHSFASIGAGSGLGLPIIGKLLGHADTRTTARYAHLDADPVRRASNQISAAIAGAMASTGKAR